MSARKRRCERGSRSITRSERRLDGATSANYWVRAWPSRPRPGNPEQRESGVCADERRRP